MLIKRQDLIVVVPLLTALFLFTFRLGYTSFWEDELYSIRDARAIDLSEGIWSPKTGFARPFGMRISRPLYYIVLRGWMFVSASDAWIRFLSVVFALGCVYLIFKLGQVVFNQTVGMVASFFFCLSPTVIEYAQEARMYALGTFLGILGSYLLIHDVKTPRLSLKLLWLLARLATILAVPVNILLFLTDLLVLKFKKALKLPRLFWALSGVVFALCVPVLYKISVEERKWLQPTQGNSISFGDWLDRISEYLISTSNGFWYQLIAFCLLLTFIISAIKVAIDSLYNTRFFLLLAWVLFPSFIINASALVYPSVYKIRYSLFLAPYFCLIVAYGIVISLKYLAKLNGRLAVILASFLSFVYIISTVPSLVNYYASPSVQDWQQAIKFIESQVDNKDCIALDQGKLTETAFFLYGKTQNNTSFPITSSSNNFQEIVRDFLSKEDTRSECRLWAITKNEENTATPELVNVENWKFTGLTVYLYKSEET